MRILHIISSLASGGAETYVRDLAKEMVCAGHTVRIAYLSDAASLGRAVDFEEAFQAQLAHSGVEYTLLGHDARRALWRGGARLRRIVAEFRPDIIHSHLYYGIIFKMLGRIPTPLVYTHHNHRLGKGRYLYPLLNRAVSHYIGISRDCAEVLSGAGAKDVVTIYNAVNTERLTVRREHDSPEEVRLLAIGRLAAQKNFSSLIEAFALLLARYPGRKGNLTLRIAGEGPLKAKLARKIADLNLSNNIALLGNRKDIPELISQSDIFVLSSDYEGLPIALLEALMSGLPVIVTDVGGCRDVVELCRGGLVVPPGEPQSLANAIETLARNRKERHDCGANALSLSRQRFSIARATDEHLSLYRNVLERGGGLT